ncbi:MAG: ComF family protein [Proteobacteria bacterium]|nr:ComF family protein [Pseudomonadota bacterium]
MNPFIKRFLNFFLPPVCSICGRVGGESIEGTICSACRRQFTPVGHPLCTLCGRPFSAGDSHLCSRCLERQPVYDLARAGGLYRNTMVTAIHGLKYHERVHLAKDLAMWTLNHCAQPEFPPQAEMIIPVPLHQRRLKERGFNQSQLLGRVLAKELHIPCDPFVLIRTKDTDPQVGLSEIERRENIRGAFAVSPGRRSRIEGKALLVLDDVMTTGATVEECARTLKSSGADKVYVLTMARVE